MNRILLLMATLAGCTAAAPAKPPSFDPVDFFTGPSWGEGMLKVVMKAGVPLRVTSEGRPDGKGGIILDQTVREGTKPARQRRWLLSPTSPTTVTGTITDAGGPVNGRLDGDRLLLNFAMRNGLKAEQVLTIQPGGRTLTNRMTIRKYGIVVAHVDELITKGP